MLLTMGINMDVDTVVQEALHREKMLEQKLGTVCIDPLSSFLLSLLCLLVITTILLTMDVDMDVDIVV